MRVAQLIGASEANSCRLPNEDFMPYLFLDFDGVLHPDAVYLERGRPILRGHGGIALFQWAPILAELMAPYPHIDIVLSTSWVPTLTFHRARAYLPASLQQRVIGATWHSHYTVEYGIDRIGWFGMTRFAQINVYVRRHCQNDNWFAIDDHPFGWPDDQLGHLVQTDSNSGIFPLEKRDEIVERLNRYESREPNP